MSDSEIEAYFRERGFTVLPPPAGTRGLPLDPDLGTISAIAPLQDKLRAAGRGAPRPPPERTSGEDDLVIVRIQPAAASPLQAPRSVVFSRRRGEVVGEQA